MQIDGWLLDILACPECHAPLRADEAASELVCTATLRPGLPGARQHPGAPGREEASREPGSARRADEPWTAGAGPIRPRRGPARHPDVVEAADPSDMLRQVASAAAQVRTALRSCAETDLSAFSPGRQATGHRGGRHGRLRPAPATCSAPSPGPAARSRCDHRRPSGCRAGSAPPTRSSRCPARAHPGDAGRRGRGGPARLPAGRRRRARDPRCTGLAEQARAPFVPVAGTVAAGGHGGIRVSPPRSGAAEVDAVGHGHPAAGDRRPGGHDPDRAGRLRAGGQPPGRDLAPVPPGQRVVRQPGQVAGPGPGRHGADGLGRPRR